MYFAKILDKWNIYLYIINMNIEFMAYGGYCEIMVILSYPFYLDSFEKPGG